MRSMPMFLRMAEELSRFPRMSPFQTFFHEPLMWSGIAVPRNWKQIARWQEQEFAPAATVGKQGYQVSLDVSVYKPNELTVKTVDNSVIIEGKSEQHEDEQGSFTSRHFLRRFVLPQGYESDKVTSTLTSDGVLTISVPNPPEVEEALKERLVPIQQTGPAENNVKLHPVQEEPEK
ncbi:heat shock protein 22 [Drosophila innubila]|uniref:heat shock protein 22 n=1 Tax=Drosophila innubila TaxID=198719 RepID=UPI00148BF95E|nr:heat shock protein 22 [Drosophila innubila]